MAKKSHVRVDINGDNPEVNDAVTVVIADALKEVLPKANIDLYNTDCNYTTGTGLDRAEASKRLMAAAKNLEVLRLVNVHGPYAEDAQLAARLAGGVDNLPQIHRHILASAAEVPPAPAPGVPAGDTVIVTNADVKVVEHCAT